MPTLPDRHSCRLTNCDISYLSEGNGPIFMMIHGMLSNAVDYYFQFKEFSNRFTCIAPDLPGSGCSHTSDPESCCIDSAAEHMLDFITETVPLERKILLMGHSYGGIIAMELLARIPERLSGIVIVSTPTTAVGTGFTKRAAPFLSKLVPLVKPLIRSRPLLNFYSNYINISPLNLTDELGDMLRERNMLIGDSDILAMRGYFESLAEWDFQLPPAASDVPAILFYGDRDILFGGREVRSMQKLIPNITCVKIPGTRHSCMHEKPGSFNEALNDFILSLDILE